MRRFFFLFLLLCINAIFASDMVVLEFYSQPGCKTCARIKNLVLPQLADRYPGQYSLTEYDTIQKEHFVRLLSVLERLKIDSNESAYMLINNSTMLAGGEIEEKLFDEIDRQHNARTEPPSISEPEASSDVLERRATGFTIGAVTLAGLIDGINPCVFSALVFFLSLLGVAKVKRR